MQQQHGPPPRMPMMNPPPMVPGSEPLPSLLSMKVDVPAELPSSELKLPQALEQALAFKSERAKEIGADSEEPGGKYFHCSCKTKQGLIRSISYVGNVSFRKGR